MEQLEKRVSYLRGLAEGLDMDNAGKEGKMLAEMIQLMDDMCAGMRELKTRMEENEQFVEAIDEDLSDLEYLLYDDEEDLYETVREADAYDLDDSEEAYLYEFTLDDSADHGVPEYEVAYEFECPSCRAMLSLSEGLDEDGYHHYVIEPISEFVVLNPT